MNRNRLFAPTLVLCSTLALVVSAPGSRTADAATVLAPATDDGRPSPPPSPSPPPIDVVVCPSICFECGGAGPICCAPEHQCFVLWMPIWFSAPGDVLDGGAGVIAPLRACAATASRPPRHGGP